MRRCASQRRLCAGARRDRRNHYPEPGERPPDGAALRADRRRPRADLRPDGRRELRPRRIPDDRDVCDVLPVRVLRDRSVAVGAAGRGGAVRVRGGGLSVDRALCGARQGQCRHGADLLDLRPRDRHARPGAVFLHAGLPQRHAFLARRQNRLDRRHLPAGAATGRRAGVRSRPSARSISSSTAPISAARSRRRARTPARWRWSASTRTGCSRWAGASARRWSACRAPSWRCSSTSIPMSARRLR